MKAIGTMSKKKKQEQERYRLFIECYRFQFIDYRLLICFGAKVLVLPVRFISFTESTGCSVWCAVHSYQSDREQFGSVRLV